MKSPGPTITVIVVGDGPIRESVEAAINQRESLIVVGSVDAAQTGETVVGLVPDVVIITEPTGDSASPAALAREIGGALPASRILTVYKGTGSVDPDPLIDGWIAGRVDLDSDVSVADAVEWVFRGEAVLDADLAAVVLDRHRQGASPFPMTPTEEEVLNRLAQGDPVEALAHDYAVTPRLVRQHAGGALARLHPPA